MVRDALCVVTEIADGRSRLDIKNNTWARGDMKFIFECSTRYRDIEIEHEKINFISPSSHVLCYLLYKFSSILSKGEYSKGHIRTRV